MAQSSQTKTATDFVDAMATGKFEQAAMLFHPTVKASLPADKLKLVWQSLIVQSGGYKQRQAPRVEDMGAHKMVFVPVVFGSKTLDMKIVFSGSNQISGFFVEPHRADWKEAPYVKPAMFGESNVKIGSGKWQLDGVLTLPKGEGPFPGVVLVHGSGPQDKDETVGGNKPFRDLAHGLASKGVAVLRYEKRTKQHSKHLTPDVLKKLTVKDETIDDAVEAAKLLRSRPEIDKTRTFILGHSLGATVVPRLVSADPDARGFIAMSGTAFPLEDVIVMQVEYIGSLGGANAEAKKQLPAMREQVAKIKKLTDQDAIDGVMVMGASAAYWIDMRNHDPLKEIENIDKPILFMQGGRDYQVTANGDFPRWKTAIKAAKKDDLCEFKLYPNLNHLYMAGTGMATPQEYLNKVGNVDETPINDIVAWIRAQSAKQSTPATEN